VGLERFHSALMPNGGNSGAAGSEDRRWLSEKRIDPQQRLIVALDTPSPAEAERLVETLGNAVGFYKLGLELLASGGCFELIERLHARGKQTFLDLKLFDVPQTVGAAVRNLRGRGIAFVTVHGNDAILRAACEQKGETQILAVTALTSFDRADIADLGLPNVSLEDLVSSRARRALQLGCDGVISSGWEVPRLRAEFGQGLTVVVPGIRPSDDAADDQKRTVDVEAAFWRGADHIVVGRPIRQAPDPRHKAQAIQQRIQRLFGH